MYVQDVEKRHSEGKFGDGAILFYLQATAVYFFIVLVCSVPLWMVCEGKDVPIYMTFNQTNTTVVSNCETLVETAEIIYTPSTLLMVFMFGVLVPKQITKADDLKKAVLDHYDSVYVLWRVGHIAQTYNTRPKQVGAYLDKLMAAYTTLVMSSMSLATIVSRRQFMTHEITKMLRSVQETWRTHCNRNESEQDLEQDPEQDINEDITQRDEAENAIIELQLDALSAIYVEVHRLANDSKNPASHGVPLNGNTPLSVVLEMTAVGQSTFDTRGLLLFFAALTAVCGFAQKLNTDGEINVDVAWVHILTNYVMVVIPYSLLGPFVFRTDIFKERCPKKQNTEEENDNDQFIH